MNGEYKVKRLGKDDIPDILKIYLEYNQLHFTPINEMFVWQVLVAGGFWGLFHGEELLSVTYMFDFDSRLFANFTAKWELEDLLGDACHRSLICGYIGGERHSKAGQAMYWLWLLQGLESRVEGLAFYTPAHFDTDFAGLFKAGFTLRGLRGLDKLVPHYIFYKTVDLAHKNDYQPVAYCPAADTIQLSKLCEKGYTGVDIKDENIIFIQGDTFI